MGTLPPMSYRRRDGVATQVIDGAASLFDPAAGELITLNRTGSVLWELLEGPSSREGMVAALAERHPDVDGGQLGADVDAFVAELHGRGLIVDAGG